MDRTHIGGQNVSFETTLWTQIRAADTLNADHRRAAEATVLGRYWKPVYAYLRRKGYDNEQAKDLTQGFFAEVVIEHDLLPKADKARGKFRTFLLTCLDRYAARAHQKEKAQKRMPAGGLVSLEGLESAGAPDPATTGTPDEAFAHAWASGLIRQVLTEVEAGCRQDQQDVHWEVFRQTVVEPEMFGAAKPALVDVSAALNIKDAKTAANMTETVKRRFGRTLRARVRDLVDSEEKVDEEIRDLMQILSRPRAAAED